MAAHTLEQQPAPPPRRAHLPLSADESARGQHTRRDQGRGHVHHSFAACRGPPLVLVPRPPARPSRCAPWTPTTPRVRATAPAAETDMDVLSRVASDAAAAGESSGGPGTGESSSGGHTPASNKRRGTNAAKRGRENVNGKGQVKGASGGASGGGSWSSSSSSVSSSAKAQPPCKGKNCSVTIKPKQGKYCKVCKGANNFICSHWLCVADGKEEGHDTLSKYGDPCPHNGVTCATVKCRRKIAASAASRGTHTICDSCRPRGARRGMKKKLGKRKNESLGDSRHGLPFAPHTTHHTNAPPGELNGLGYTCEGCVAVGKEGSERCRTEVVRGNKVAQPERRASVGGGRGEHGN